MWHILNDKTNINHSKNLLNAIKIICFSVLFMHIDFFSSKFTFDTKLKDILTVVRSASGCTEEWIKEECGSANFLIVANIRWSIDEISVWSKGRLGIDLTDTRIEKRRIGSSIVVVWWDCNFVVVEIEINCAILRTILWRVYITYV